MSGRKSLQPQRPAPPPPATATITTSAPNTAPLTEAQKDDVAKFNDYAERFVKEGSKIKFETIRGLLTTYPKSATGLPAEITAAREFFLQAAEELTQNIRKYENTQILEKLEGMVQEYENGTLQTKATSPARSATASPTASGPFRPISPTASTASSGGSPTPVIPPAATAINNLIKNLSSRIQPGTPNTLSLTSTEVSNIKACIANAQDQLKINPESEARASIKESLGDLKSKLEEIRDMIFLTGEAKKSTIIALIKSTEQASIARPAPPLPPGSERPPSPPSRTGSPTPPASPAPSGTGSPGPATTSGSLRTTPDGRLRADPPPPGTHRPAASLASSRTGSPTPPASPTTAKKPPVPAPRSSGIGTAAAAKRDNGGPNNTNNGTTATTHF